MSAEEVKAPAAEAVAPAAAAAAPAADERDPNSKKGGEYMTPRLQ